MPHSTKKGHRVNLSPIRSIPFAAPHRHHSAAIITVPCVDLGAEIQFAAEILDVRRPSDDGKGVAGKPAVTNAFAFNVDNYPNSGGSIPGE